MAGQFENVVVVDHPLVQHKLSILRNKDTSPGEFRQLVRELTLLEGYEATRHLRLEPVEVETPIQVAECRRLSGLEPAIVPILRAGLGMLDGLIELMPTACVGHLGMERDETTHEPAAYYAKMPPHIEKRQVVVVDPMLATGGSASLAIAYLRNLGVRDIVLMVLVAAPEGIRAVRRECGDVPIFTCAIDDGLNGSAYIVPGLGDAGDRIFGTVVEAS